MDETCFCGRTGPLTDRVPVVVEGETGLQCPSCGHLDRLAGYGWALASRLWFAAKERELSAE